MEAGDQAVLNIQTKDYDVINPNVTSTDFILKKYGAKNWILAGQVEIFEFDSITLIKLFFLY